MPSRSLWLGFGASALVLGAVGAVASGIDWDPRDVEAAERYRQQEQQRAERYRSEVAGVPSSARSEAPSERTSWRIARAEAREARRQDRQDRRDRGDTERWWSRTVEGVAGSVDVEELRETFEGWGAWWRDEAAPAWEEWAEEQEARVHRLPAAEPQREPSAPSGLPAKVERILEESLSPEEATAVRREAQQALDWWAEERERMRARYGSHGDR